MEPDSTPAPFLFGRGVFIWPWRGAWCGDRDGGPVVPDIVTVAWAAVCGAPGRHRAWGARPRRIGALVKTYARHH